MSKTFRFSYILILCFFTTLACKSDNTDSEEEGMSNEDLYFKDYESPEFKWGFIDTSGQLLIADQYDAARPFKNGRAIVKKNGKWGMIDKDNQELIGFNFRALYPFQNDLARFQDFEMKYGYIDTKGEIKISAKFAEAHDFNDGLAKVIENGLFGFINKEGKFAIDAQYRAATNFKDGRAKVKSSDSYVLINKEAIKEIDANFDQVYFPSSGLTRVKKSNKFGFYKNKKQVISPTYDMATDFHDGIAAVLFEDKWSFIDAQGRVKKKLNYEMIEYGNEGFWMVSKDGKFGMINSNNDPVIPVEFDMLYKFKEDRCAYQVEGFWGFYDHEGEVITPPVFALVWDYVNGKARVLTREGLAIIDKKGLLSFIAPSTEMRDFSEGLAPIQIIN